MREAVAFANAGAGDDEIVFAPGLTGVIRLSLGEIEITDAVTITGGGITITGDASGNDSLQGYGAITDVITSDQAGALDDNSRIFNITDASAATSLTGLTLTGGRADAYQEDGGAILSAANLSLDQVTIAGNSVDATVGEGGGIFVTGVLDVTDSTISRNYTMGFVGDGGGVFAGGASTFVNTTVAANVTQGQGADGAGLNLVGPATLINVTITGNLTTGENADGAGVYAEGDLRLINSILVGNVTSQATTGNDEFGIESGGALTLAGANILRAGETFGLPIGSDVRYYQTADQVFRDTLAGSGGVPVGVLDDNYGPVRTVALKASSVAIDAGLSVNGLSVPATDSRGLTRVYDPSFGPLNEGTAIDIGAFEYLRKEANSLVVTTTDDIVNSYDNQTSLREAVAFANSDAAAATITFAAGGQGLIRLTEGALSVTTGGGELTIDGGGLVTITGDALGDDETLEGGLTDVSASSEAQLSDNSRIIQARSDITLSGLTLTGGHTTGEEFDGKGGAIYGTRAVTITDSTLTGNGTAGYRAVGGAVYANDDLTITNSFIRDNQTEGGRSSGGGVYADDNLILQNSEISGNSTNGAFSQGGGAFVGREAMITGSTISGNTTNDEYSDGGVFGPLT